MLERTPPYLPHNKLEVVRLPIYANPCDFYPEVASSAVALKVSADVSQVAAAVDLLVAAAEASTGI